MGYFVYIYGVIFIIFASFKLFPYLLMLTGESFPPKKSLVCLFLTMLLSYLLIMRVASSKVEVLISGSLLIILWIIAFIDIYTLRMPVVLIIVLFLLAGLNLFFLNRIKDIYISLLIACLFAIIMISLAIIFKKHLIGSGDLLIIIILSTFYSWKAFYLFFFIAFLIGCLYSIIKYFLKKNHQVPFGPFIVISFLLVYCFQQKVWDFYLLFIRGVNHVILPSG